MLKFVQTFFSNAVYNIMLNQNYLEDVMGRELGFNESMCEQRGKYFELIYSLLM